MTEPEPGEGRPEEPPAPPPIAKPRAPIPTVSPALLEFFGSVRALTPRGFVTEALVAINVLVFAIMVIRGVSPMEPKVDDLLAWGAGYGPRTTGGEWWRLLTATFLHVGIFHLAMNMYVLWDAGRLMERVFGNAGFLLLYVASGICGSAASAVWSPYVVSAGASGSVFGVYGGLLGFLLRERASIPREALQRLQRSGLLFVGLNVMIGLQVKGIDMAAHLGGLAGGFVSGVILAHPLDPAGASRRWARNALLAALAAAGTLVAVRVMPRHDFDFWSELHRFDEIEKRSLAVYDHALQESKADRMSDEQLAVEIDARVLPDWHASRVRLEAARGLPQREARLVDALVAYMTAREEGFRLVSEAGHTHDPSLVEKANEKHAEAARLAKEIGNADKKK